ncbi:MAG: phosphatidate cytidylyltransferase, partial [Bdellovibrionales bacterium]|nr:phosphatidate cytidylyltransferase [Bdellovibrionales bacterium]
MSEHVKRVVTAAALLAFGIGVYFWLRQLGVQILVAAASIAAYWEFLDILLDKSTGSRRFKFWSALAAAALMILLLVTQREWTLTPVYFAFLLFMGQALVASHRHGQPEVHLKDALVQVFGLFYITGFLSFVPEIHAMPNGPVWFILLLGIVWGSDIAAYYGGKAMGRNKLSPNLSPGKTMEGSATALVVNALAAWPVHHFFLPETAAWKLAVIMVLTSAAAMAGDLLESLVKRV